jgi:Uma2 family endonuclease
MPESLMTADDLLRLPLPGKQTELIRGTLIVHEPPGTWHGALAARLSARLTVFGEQGGLGMVFSQDTGFKIASQPDTVRAPDVAFIKEDRLHGIPDRGYAELAPDLVAEIVSPNDRPGEVLAKVADWLQAGTTLVWVIDPARRIARVYRSDGSESVLSEGDALDGEDLLPGFACRLDELLRRQGEG